MLATDNELLGRHVFGDDPTAFEELLRRHSAMVMNVCRTMLLNRQDAEDAFQATFLVLSRKAATLTNRNSIAPWLYHVAVRNCLQARRLHRKKGTTAMIEEPVGSENEPWLSITQAQDCELIHREIDQLPEQYRNAIVVCHVQGHSRSEAAELLDKSEASIKAALARGRNLLRQRLIRRGVMTTALLGTIAAGTQSAQAAVTESLIQATMQTCSMSSVAGTAGPISSVSSIANNGVTMTTSLFTKSLILTAGITLICLPLLVVAQTGGTAIEDQQETIKVTIEQTKPAASETKTVEIAKQEQRQDNQKKVADVVDPRRFDINNSEDYWKLILQSLELKLQEQEESLRLTAKLVSKGMASKNELNTNGSRSKTFEIKAKILEARLNIERIRHENKNGASIDPRRIPPASTAAVRPGEVLQIKSSADDWLNDPRVVVAADHSISITLLGTIDVRGKTPDEIEKVLTEGYLKYVKQPGLFVRRYSAFDAEQSLKQQ